ncbi:MAG: hypothetical protein WD509_01815 [Candidatus Paceibacterota bacterium]
MKQTKNRKIEHADEGFIGLIFDLYEGLCDGCRRSLDRRVQEDEESLITSYGIIKKEVLKDEF